MTENQVKYILKKKALAEKEQKLVYRGVAYLKSNQAV